MGNTGWLFPPECDSFQGRITPTGLEQSVQQSIKMILSTKKGERYLHPEFGCDVYKFLFHGSDYTTLKRIEHEITQSILTWEHRISELEVSAAPDRRNPGRILVDIVYLIPELSSMFQQSHAYQ